MNRASRRRLLWLSGCALVFVALLLHDAAIAPRGFGTRAAIAAIGQYQRVVSPRLRGTVRCRFQPTCSVYGLDAIRKDGLLIGGSRAAWRIARCGPWTKEGTVDRP